MTATAPDSCVNPFTESLVVMHVFQSPNGFKRTTLDRELSDLDPDWIAESIASLQQAGVLHCCDGRLYPSEQLSRLTELHMIGC